jgi:hypothetical protein
VDVPGRRSRPSATARAPCDFHRPFSSRTPSPERP